MNDPSTRVARRLLTGRYALEEHLGSGGAGDVWRAHDRLLDRIVAVKLLHGEVGQDPPAATRFRAEASMAAKLTHPNAVIVYDIGRDGGHEYLVMEYVEGGTLADVLSLGPMTPGVVAGLGAQVGGALGVAHHRRLVHRDVKPANVLITTDGVAKVADFGIAQALGATSTRLTAPGRVMGTARYLAPEQLRGEVVDARADVYSLGVLLHESLTGEVPFGEGTMVEVAARRLVASLPRVSESRSDVPFALDDAIWRATQLEPADRFADGGEFAAELTRSSTPGASRELAARIAARTSRSSTRSDRAVVTADLATDEPPPAAGTGGSAHEDEPTAMMASHVAPASLPPEAPGRQPSAAQEAPETPRKRLETSDEQDPGTRGEGADATGLLGRVHGRRTVLATWLVLAVVVGAGAVIALDRSDETAAPVGEATGDEGENLDPEDDDPDEAADDDAEDAAVEIVDAGDHDPFGSGEEHGSEVANAFDGDTATSWQTQGYRGNPELGGLKPGVGIWFDLGDERELGELEVAMGAPGASFTLYAGASPPGPADDPQDWGRAVAEVADADSLTRVALEEPAEGRVWLLWFTSLPEDGSGYRATVSDVRPISS